MAFKNRVLSFGVLLSFPAKSLGVGCFGGQGSAGVGPTERFGEGTIEVLDELEQAVLESGQGRKVSTLHNAPSNDSKYDLDLIEPRRMLRYIHKPNAMVHIVKEGLSRLYRFQNARFLLLPQRALVRAFRSERLSEKCD